MSVPNETEKTQAEETVQTPAEAAAPAETEQSAAAEHAPEQILFFLMTEDVTLGGEESPVTLHSGDVVRLAGNRLEVNGTPAETALTAEAAAKISESGEETDEAFYLKTTGHAEAGQPAGEVSADTEEQEPEKQEEAYTAKQLLEDALDLVESVLTSVFVVMMVFTFIFCVATVEGDSMVPTLTSGDRLMVNRFFKNYSNGDILILNSRTAYIMDKESGDFFTRDGLGKRIVKRLIAQAGQEVNIDFDAGVVYIDGEALDEPYTNTLTKRDSGAFSYPFTVPEGYVFVLGDNRNVSRDSRHPDVGMVPVDDVVGSVVIRLTPLSKFGKLAK